jgi:peptidoglycan/xylan/chitin deacetylase (PgdA/CDA1 family)
LDLKEPIVSFTFDDVPISAVINGERILKKYNYSGTYYIAAGLMINKGFDFNESDSLVFKQIVADGGELGCHTFNHLHFFKSNRGQIISDLEKNQLFIEENMAGYKFQNFSYPFGEQTASARAVIKNRFRSGRSNYDGINFCNVDLNCLKCIRLYELVSLDRIKSKINKAISKKGWIIFYTHDVELSPSKEGCTPWYFEEVVKYCFDRKLTVLPVNKVLDLIEQ